MGARLIIIFNEPKERNQTTLLKIRNKNESNAVHFILEIDAIDVSIFETDLEKKKKTAVELKDPPSQKDDGISGKRVNSATTLLSRHLR